MSRIFEALRRAEKERAATAARSAEVRTQAERVEAAGRNGRSGAARELESAVERAAVTHINCAETIVAHLKQHSGAERFRVLRQRLLQIREQRPLGCLLVSSPAPGDGKTLVAINLAASIATSNPRVLLMDTDMRRSGVNEAFGLASPPGLAEVLEGRLNAEQALREVPLLNLYFLPAGNPTQNPAELLESGGLRETIAMFRRVFDWVLIDSPPLNPFADARAVAASTDAALLVLRSGRSRGDEAQRALRSLEGTYVAGVVLNGSEDSRDEGYYGYYHYGQGTGEKSSTRAPQIPTHNEAGVRAMDRT